jgi:hypothetical protein
MADPANPGAYKPVPGGPHDPNNAAMGSRESVYHQRMVGSANQALNDIKNIVELPVGATTGTFGVGSSPGASMLSSAKSALLNKVADQDVQDFNSIVPGIERSLATIETAGLVPSNSFTGSFGSLLLRPGDTEYTKMGKLAQMRQIIEAGLEPALSNPRLGKDQKEFVNKMLADLKQAVPFSRNDVTQLRREQEKNPSMTIKDMIAGHNPGGKAAGKPKVVTQNGHTYTLNEATGEYE